MATIGTLAERLLSLAIEKNVSDELGNIMRKTDEFKKDMSEADQKAAKLLILEMVKKGCDAFYIKMKDRIEKNGK